MLWYWTLVPYGNVIQGFDLLHLGEIFCVQCGWLFALSPSKTLKVKIAAMALAQRTLAAFSSCRSRGRVHAPCGKPGNLVTETHLNGTRVSQSKESVHLSEQGGRPLRSARLSFSSC